MQIKIIIEVREENAHAESSHDIRIERRVFAPYSYFDRAMIQATADATESILRATGKR